MILLFPDTFWITSSMSRQNAFFSYSVHLIYGAYTLMTLHILVFKTNLTAIIWLIVLITSTILIFIALSNITPTLFLRFSCVQNVIAFPILLLCFLSNFLYNLVFYTHVMSTFLFFECSLQLTTSTCHWLYIQRGSS